MIASANDLLVSSQEDFDLLPDDGRFEVLDGVVQPMPPPELAHQALSDELLHIFKTQIQPGHGWVFTLPNVRIPSDAGYYRSRIPDLVVSKIKPKKRYELDNPPDLIIEILSTPLGNVERTAKVEDYACAGIAEYWIIDPFERRVEVYHLEGGAYPRQPQIEAVALRLKAFPGIEIHLELLWRVLD